MRYVVIGAGPAGVTAVETLRAQDPAGEILLIGGEPEPVYSRMAIPYLLANQIDESGTYLRRGDHFRKLSVRLVQDAVAKVDTAGRTLTLASGGTEGYDRLLIATGSVPVEPPIPGLDRPGVHHCWTLEDARKIAAGSVPGAHVALLGAGFIGCIIMEALAACGVRLTMVEMGDRMVPRMMDGVAGSLIKEWCTKKGVEVRTSARVLKIERAEGGEGRYRLLCEGSEPVPADLVVVAAGERPCTDFLEGSGIEVRKGVVVDDRLQSSVPGVYAAGDCCEGMDWSTGSPGVHAIQPVAVETGRVAALNMAGKDTPYAGSMDMNVLDTLGLICTSYGRWMGVDGGDSGELLDAEGFRYLKLQFEDDRLIGAIALGMTQHIGVIRGLIQSRLSLGAWKDRLTQDPTRVMEAYLASTQALDVV